MMVQVLKRVNTVLLPLAARGLFGVWAVIHTRGRKSGKAYATPIAVEATSDSFIVGLPYGEGVDWCRNVVASGTATITWRGIDHVVSQPRIVDRADIEAFYPAPLRLALRLFGIRRFLVLSRV